MTERGPDRRPIRVVIADDEPMIVRYVSVVLSLEEDDFEVVGVATDAGHAVDLVNELEPDVLVLDLRMPGSGLQAAQLLSAAQPTTRVLVYTADADGSELLSLLRAGISGYLTKSATPDEIVAAVRAVAEGQQTFVPDIAAKAVGELTTRLHAERSAEVRGQRVRQRIERAIGGRAFHIVCQPVIDLATGAPCGVEALTRFTGPPDRPPDEWFAEADTVNKRIDLELATAAAALKVLGSLAEPLWLAINLSPATVLSGVIGRLFAGIDLTRIVIELTEHASVEDYGFLNATLDTWRERGLRVAVDDAGAGYASLAHIVKTRPDLIKLDHTLTAGIDTEVELQALARAMSGYASTMSIELVAEGIETKSQLDMLYDLGARYGQGYYLGRPAPFDEQPALHGGAPASITLEPSVDLSAPTAMQGSDKS